MARRVLVPPISPARTLLDRFQRCSAGPLPVLRPLGHYIRKSSAHQLPSSHLAVVAPLPVLGYSKASGRGNHTSGVASDHGMCIAEPAFRTICSALPRAQSINWRTSSSAHSGSRGRERYSQLRLQNPPRFCDIDRGRAPFQEEPNALSWLMVNATQGSRQRGTANGGRPSRGTRTIVRPGDTQPTSCSLRYPPRYCPVPPWSSTHAEASPWRVRPGGGPPPAARAPTPSPRRCGGQKRCGAGDRQRRHPR